MVYALAILFVFFSGIALMAFAGDYFQNRQKRHDQAVMMEYRRERG